jgi:thiol-disulfide isomerase/thioredoxin
MKTKKIFDIIFYLILGVLLIQRVPVLLSQYKIEGKKVDETKFTNLKMQQIDFPPRDQKSVAVFWATWCGPCSLELSRINKAILDKEIDSRFIYVVNVDEDPSLVRSEFIKRKYNFDGYFNKDLAIQLNVQGTPTVVFIDENKNVEWISTGISPSLIYRTRNFLPKVTSLK